jgi:hypothetical protein
MAASQYNYQYLVDQLGYYCQQYGALANPDFTASIPTFIQNAELRIYRELDPLATRQQNATVQMTAYSRKVPLDNMTGVTVDGYPVYPNYPIVVQALSAIVPIAGLQPIQGVRVRFLRVSVDFIDNVWPTEGMVAPPGSPCAYYAMLDHKTIIVAPTPDQNYTAEVTGTWRPAPMSPTNPNTYLGDFMWDLFFSACMVEAAGWMRDYGMQSDDPKLALSWEERYQSNLKNALEEEQRRKSQDPGWQPFQPTPFSGTPRP